MANICFDKCVDVILYLGEIPPKISKFCGWLSIKFKENICLAILAGIMLAFFILCFIWLII